MPEPAALQSLAAKRRGVCPTLAEPMLTGDGLLARFRPVGSRLSVEGLKALARAGRHYGNGQIEITARGSLQVRGVRTDAVQVLGTELRKSIDVETGIPVETQPLAGLEVGIDSRELAARLRAEIARLELVLSPKVSVLVDGSGGLDDISGDVRARYSDDGWSIRMGGITRLASGEDAVVFEVLAALARIARRGPVARGRDFGGDPLPKPQEARLGGFTFGDVHIFGVGLGFGGLDADSLEQIAVRAENDGVSEVRVAPGRALYFVGGNALSLAHDAQALGFLTSQADPRGAIAACAGQRGCSSGLIDARGLAGELSGVLAKMLDHSFTLHVSGCSKGCAHPRNAGVTLVGTTSGVTVVLNGTAKEPGHIEIPRADVVSRFAALECLFLSRRHAQESAGDWLDRIGPTAIAKYLAQGSQ